MQSSYNQSTPHAAHGTRPHAYVTLHISHTTPRHTAHGTRHTVTVFLLSRTEGTFDHVQFHCLGTSLVRVTRFRCGNLLFEIFHGLMGRREYTALVTYTRTCTCRMYTAHGTTIIHCIHSTVSGTSKTIQHSSFSLTLGTLTSGVVIENSPKMIGLPPLTNPEI